MYGMGAPRPPRRVTARPARPVDRRGAARRLGAAGWAGDKFVLSALPPNAAAMRRGAHASSSGPTGRVRKPGRCATCGEQPGKLGPRPYAEADEDVAQVVVDSPG